MTQKGALLSLEWGFLARRFSLWGRFFATFKLAVQYAMMHVNFSVKDRNKHKMNEKIVNSNVQFLTINDDEAGQRLDNFLLARLKGVPKSLIYRIVRKGEVRVNKGRSKPEYKLQADDVVRIPPVRVAEKAQETISNKLTKVAQLEQQIIFEDNYLLVLNKPSGIAVHGGSGLDFGVIEALRALRPEARFLELVHRLDRDTSGILLVAKNVQPCAIFMNNCVKKQYKKSI